MEKKTPVMDTLFLNANKDIRKHMFPDEYVYFSAKLTKFNDVNHTSERIFFITDLRIGLVYQTFFKHYKITRSTQLELIPGVVISTTSDQFTFLVPDEHDYWFTTPDYRQHILAIFTNLYNKHTSNMLYNNEKKLLPFYFTTDIRLMNYSTTKADKKKGISKFPQFQSVVMQPEMPEDKYSKISKKKVKSVKKEEKKKTCTVFIRNQDHEEVSLDSFNIIKVLGRGSFGKVMLVQHKQAQQFYAMKSLRKDFIIDKDQVEHTLAEREILEKAKHPFLVNLEFAFQNEEKLYLVMGFQKGGELFTHLRKVKRFPEKQVKFYTSQLILAIGHLHEKQIVYRDLKPENILLDEFGYASITDYGMSKFLKKGDLTNSFCGSPEYLSPEMIIGNGHNQATDWWSLGILIYEMLFSIPPFYQKNLQFMYQMILYAEVKFPKQVEISEECKDFIKQLLNKNKQKRIGQQIKDIKSHPWLADISWDDIFNRSVKPPFIPRTYGEKWIENFDKQYTNEAPLNSKGDGDNILLQEYNDLFKDFTFVKSISEEKKCCKTQEKCQKMEHQCNQSCPQ